MRFWGASSLSACLDCKCLSFIHFYFRLLLGSGFFDLGTSFPAFFLTCCVCWRSDLFLCFKLYLMLYLFIAPRLRSFGMYFQFLLHSSLLICLCFNPRYVAKHDGQCVDCFRVTLRPSVGCDSGLVFHIPTVLPERCFISTCLRRRPTAFHFTGSRIISQYGFLMSSKTTFYEFKEN